MNWQRCARGSHRYWMRLRHGEGNVFLALTDFRDGKPWAMTTGNIFSSTAPCAATAAQANPTPCIGWWRATAVLWGWAAAAGSCTNWVDTRDWYCPVGPAPR